ncbi:MAG: hypothetical protein QNJ55_08240 [Xenococcus sp. MO_188.B8]|nr:hypothetical protein [Xenococcus sp. MO_188.B8]
MEYLLSVGLSFATASWGLKELIKTDADFANPQTKKRWMLCWNENKRAAKQIPARSLVLYRIKLCSQQIVLVGAIGQSPLQD